MRPSLLMLFILAAPAVCIVESTAAAEESEDELKARLIEQLDALDAMEVRVGEIRNQVRRLPSADDLDLEGVGKVQTAAWEARALGPSATAMATGFRESWPNLHKTLARFLSSNDAYRKNGEVEETLRTIGNSPDIIEADLSARANDYASSLDSSRMGLASALELMDTARASAMPVHARNAAEQADNIHALASGILAVYPTDPQPGTEPARPMDDKQRAWSETARDSLPLAKDGRIRAEKKLEDLAAAAKAKLAKARFPAPKLSGGDWTGLAKQASALISKSWKTPPERVLRVGIESGWKERREWKRRNGSWSWEQYRFFEVRAALELDGGRCMVYTLTFRQDKTSGGWGALHLWGVGNSFYMLLENVAL